MAADGGAQVVAAVEGEDGRAEPAGQPAALGRAERPLDPEDGADARPDVAQRRRGSGVAGLGRRRSCRSGSRPGRGVRPRRGVHATRIVVARAQAPSITARPSQPVGGSRRTTSAPGSNWKNEPKATAVPTSVLWLWATSPVASTFGSTRTGVRRLAFPNVTGALARPCGECPPGRRAARGRAPGRSRDPERSRSAARTAPARRRRRRGGRLPRRRRRRPPGRSDRRRGWRPARSRRSVRRWRRRPGGRDPRARRRSPTVAG